MSNAQKSVSWAAIGVIVTLVCTVGGWIWGTSAASSTITQHGQRLDDHETRLRTQEAVGVEIKTDVKWIRQALEKKHE